MPRSVRGKPRCAGAGLAVGSRPRTPEALIPLFLLFAASMAAQQPAPSTPGGAAVEPPASSPGVTPEVRLRADREELDRFRAERDAARAADGGSP